MKRTDIAIIIPLYNGARWIQSTLTGYTDLQDWNEQNIDYQIVVVNDGSTDESEEIVENFIISHPKVRLISDSNHGHCVARNTGISKADADYIFFADADDLILPNSLPRLVNIIKNNNLDILWFGHIELPEQATFDDVTTKLQAAENIRLNTSIGGHQFATKTEINKSQTAHVWNYIYSRRLLETYKLQFVPNIICGEDILFNLTAQSFNPTIGIINNPIIGYRKNAQSITNNRDIKHIKKIHNNDILLAQKIKSIAAETLPDDFNTVVNATADYYTFHHLLSLIRYNNSKETMRETINNLKQKNLYPLGSLKPMRILTGPSKIYNILHFVVNHPRLLDFAARVNCRKTLRKNTQK